MSFLTQILELLKKPFHKKSEEFIDYDEDEPYENMQPEPFEPEQLPEQQEAPVDDSNQGVMQSIDDLPNKKRLLIMGTVTIVLAVGLILGIRMTRNKAVKPSQPVQSTAEADIAKNSGKSAAGAQPTLGGPVMVNPFVEANGINTKTVAQSLPSVPGNGSSGPSRAQYSGNSSLPSIPSYNPRPSLPQIPMPASSPSGSTSSTTVVSSAAPATIQGIVTGEDGNNMAIMSDGSVVSKGESFKDGRVAYIGGDGIQFENGTTMNFNQ